MNFSLKAEHFGPSVIALSAFELMESDT